MENKSALSTLRFIIRTVIILALVFCAVIVTVINFYKPVVKAYINGEFIGYFSNEQQFDTVYNDLVAEKQNIDSKVKVYLESEPTFETSYVRESLLSEQNVYTNLRSKIKTEYTIYEVAVNDETKMVFSSEDEANKYSENLKSEVKTLNVNVNEKKVEELDNITSIERADAILKDIVDRNKPVETPKATTKTITAKTYNYSYELPTSVSTTAANISTTDGVWPTISRTINCAYMGYAGHTGIDLKASIGTDVYAYKSGTVVYSGWSNAYGYNVKIDHGNGLSTLYAHNSSLLVSVGQTVSAGQLISKSGSTGWSTGPHLHFEVRINGVPVNPYPYIAGK